MVDFRSLQTFVRIADSGSLSAAARASGRSLPAVSRSLVQLETELGVRLLQRTTRRIHLTDAGTQYLERCRRILAEVDDANAGVSDLGRSLAGPITLTAPVLFGQMHVAPVVAEFLGLHAGVTISLVLSDSLASIVEEGIDLAVRIGNLQDSGMLARRLGEVRRVVCASPAYLKSHGVPATPKDLADHECLQFGALSPTPYWEFQVAGRLRQIRVSGNLACNLGAPVIDAARKGLGIVRALSYQVQDAVAAGDLRVILRNFEPPAMPVHALLPSSRLQPARVRAIAALLQARIGAANLGRLRKESPAAKAGPPAVASGSAPQ